MPDEADPNKTPKLDVELVSKVVDAYHGQTDGPRFKAISSQWGVHIIPAQVRNADGHFIEARSLLDTPITVPLAKRTAGKHFQEICAAVTTSTGITLKAFGPYFNVSFAPSSLKFDPINPTTEDVEKMSFDWGATGMTAREAVLSLLEHSSTTLSWKVLCEPTEGFCVFNIAAVEVNFVGSDGKTSWAPLFHDREKASNPQQ